MSTKTGVYKGHKFHGDPLRFEVVAEFINKTFGKKITFIADVAGGRGMLSRILNKKYNYQSTVFDPRGFALTGVPSKTELFDPKTSSVYDLVVGLHPDEATRAVVESAEYTNTVIIPCCNFWDRSRKLGREALLAEIELSYKEKGINFKRVTFEFEGPKNIGILTYKK